MRNIKKISMRIFLSCELLCFAYFYLFGSHGVRTLMAIEQETGLLAADINEMKATMNDLETTIAQWDQHPFYKEKIAREQLQLVGKNEEVYYIA